MSTSEFSAAFKGSPIKRAQLRGLERNASVVVGNIGEEEDVAALAVSLANAEPLVRGHTAWALGEIGSSGALGVLRARLVVESDPFVLEAVDRALERGAG